jgi:hypothetical protein
MCAPADAGIVLDEWHKLEDGADASEEDPREPPSVSHLRKRKFQVCPYGFVFAK